MPPAVYQVDAFTDKPFAGNPAAVILLPDTRDDAWLQDVAAEMNLSETAYLVKREDGSFDLRWFTPMVEADLCGHATLASAHTLWETGQLARHAEVRFHTRSGLLKARLNDGMIVLNFPATKVTLAECPPGLPSALGAVPSFVGQSPFDYLVELKDAETVRRLEPDFGEISKLGVRGVIVTARAAMPGYDIISRCFAPGVGIDEDPVTGSAHCALGPYWSGKLGKSELMAYQASRRGGTVRVTVAGDRVRLAGHAVTVMRAELLHC